RLYPRRTRRRVEGPVQHVPADAATAPRRVYQPGNCGQRVGAGWVDLTHRACGHQQIVGECSGGRPLEEPAIQVIGIGHERRATVMCMTDDRKGTQHVTVGSGKPSPTESGPMTDHPATLRWPPQQVHPVSARPTGRTDSANADAPIACVATGWQW